MSGPEPEFSKDLAKMVNDAQDTQAAYTRLSGYIERHRVAVNKDPWPYIKYLEGELAKRTKLICKIDKILREFRTDTAIGLEPDEIMKNSRIRELLRETKLGRNT